MNSILFFTELILGWSQMVYKPKNRKKPLRVKRENNRIKLIKLIYKKLDNCLKKIDKVIGN